MPALLTKNLAVVCPACDYLNVIAAIRCMSCGAATDKTAPATLAPPPLPPPRIVKTPPPAPVAAPPSESKVASSPSRPPFKSSPSSSLPTPGIKFGLTVVAGPSAGRQFRLPVNGAQLGRTTGTLLFPDDLGISPLHATFSITEGKLMVHDLQSQSGVYVSIAGTETVPTGGMFCAGSRFFRYNGVIDTLPSKMPGPHIYGATPLAGLSYSIEEVLMGGRPGRCQVSPGPVVLVGRGPCDWSYPSDAELALRHCEISPLPDGAMIRDLSSGLGTYVRITDERQLRSGDKLRIGAHTLQIEAL